MKNIIFISPPAAGKGTQSKLLSQEYNIPHISAGDLLRDEVASGSELGLELKAIMDAGKLVGLEDILKLLENRLSKDDCQNGYILDGYPRNKENVEAWDKILTDIVDIKAVFFFDCSHELMKKRIYGRKDGRNDDNEETIIKRINIFENETKPLLSIFEKKRLLIRIDCNKKMEDIYEDVKNELKSLKVL